MACIETTFAVDILRGTDEKAREKIQALEKNKEILYIAAPTIGELISGAILNPRLEKEKERVIEFIFSFIVLDLDKDSAIKSGEIEAELTKKGAMIQGEDIMIAAIALQNNETLITRNKKHFERVPGLKIEGY